MSTFVLVHGAWHGSWCWSRLVPILEASGHRVVTTDLPGRTSPDLSLSELTLNDYADHLAYLVAAESEPVVLVGHSLGGASITQAAEYCPSQVGVLVYLAAYVPGDGESAADWALRDVDSSLSKFLRFDQNDGRLEIDHEGVDVCLYGDCAQSEREYARERLCDEPLGPVVEPLCLTSQRAHSVPAVYIECLLDRAVTLPLQRQMQSGRDFRGVHSLNSAHSPFLSQPEQLAGVLTHPDLRPSRR